MTTLLHLAALAATILVLARVQPAVRIKGPGTALVVAVVFSVLNYFLGYVLGWLIRVVLLVPALFTLGALFMVVPFIVNAVLLWLTDKVMASFEIRTLRALLLSSVVLTVVNAVFSAVSFHSLWNGVYQSHPRWI